MTGETSKSGGTRKSKMFCIAALSMFMLWATLFVSSDVSSNRSHPRNAGFDIAAHAGAVNEHIQYPDVDSKPFYLSGEKNRRPVNKNIDEVMTINGLRAFLKNENLLISGSEKPIVISEDEIIGRKYFSNGNTNPDLSIDDDALSYTEGDSATQIDSSATASDPDGAGDWDGGTLTIQITGNAEGADELSIPDNGVTNIQLMGGTGVCQQTPFVHFGTTNVNWGIVTNNSVLSITFNSNATNTLVQNLIRSICYRNTSVAPGTSDRTITLTLTDKNSGAASDTRTVSLSAVNSSPTDISLTNSSVDENVSAGTAVGTFSTTDIDN